MYSLIYVQEISGRIHRKFNNGFYCREGLGVWDVQIRKEEGTTGISRVEIIFQSYGSWIDPSTIHRKFNKPLLVNKCSHLKTGPSPIHAEQIEYWRQEDLTWFCLFLTRRSLFGFPKPSMEHFALF